MAKRKQPTVKNIIDTAKKACTGKETTDKYEGELVKLTAKIDSKVLEDALVKATTDESSEVLVMLNSTFAEEILTSALIELAARGNLNGVIKLANADDLGDPGWVLQRAMDQAKRNNISEDIIEILGLAIEENEGDEGDEDDMQALGENVVELHMLV